MDTGRGDLANRIHADALRPVLHAIATTPPAPPTRTPPPTPTVHPPEPTDHECTRCGAIHADPLPARWSYQGRAFCSQHCRDTYALNNPPHQPPQIPEAPQPCTYCERLHTPHPNEKGQTFCSDFCQRQHARGYTYSDPAEDNGGVQ